MPYDPRQHGALCDQCPRKAQTPVPPSARPGARLAWIGQDPGKQEVRKGAPFVGPTGKRIDRLWGEAFTSQGFEPPGRAEIHVTNAALCAPLTKATREAKKAVQCCRPRLMAEIATLHPEGWWLLMGKWAIYAMTGQEEKTGALLGFHQKVRRPFPGENPGPDLRR